MEALPGRKAPNHMTQTWPNFSDSYVFGIEHLFEQTLRELFGEPYIMFVESDRGMSLEITVDNKKIYDRVTNIPSKRRCIENFFIDMMKKGLKP